jgi:hypothetical protein
MSEQVDVITIRDYTDDEDFRDIANQFMSHYGYEPREVGEIRFTAKTISFCVRKPYSPNFVWEDHERNDSI